jgi:hypothetical protein
MTMLEVYTNPEYILQKDVERFVTQFKYVMDGKIYVSLYAEKNEDDFLRLLRHYARQPEFIDRYKKFRPQVVKQLVCIYTAKNCI